VTELKNSSGEIDGGHLRGMVSYSIQPDDSDEWKVEATSKTQFKNEQ
jgi:hypothetical protein